MWFWTVVVEGIEALRFWYPSYDLDQKPSRRLLWMYSLDGPVKQCYDPRKIHLQKSLSEERSFVDKAS